MSSEPIPPTIPSTEPPSARPIPKWRWAIHLVLFALLPLLAAVMAGIRPHQGPALAHTAKGAFVSTAVNMLAFGILFGLAWLASRATKGDLLLRWRPGSWVVPLGLVYSVAIRIALGIVLSIVFKIAVVVLHPSVEDLKKFAATNRPHIETLVDLRALSENPAYFWLNVIFVSFVLGGFREELWRSSFLAGLRSLWPKAFASEKGAIYAVAVAAIFFGIGHIPQGWLAACAITVVGFLLGIIMTLHRSIWPSVVAHGFFDSTSFALLLLIPWLETQYPELKSVLHGA